MNLPNKLTVLRIFLVIIFLILIEFPFTVSFSRQTNLIMRILGIIVFTGAIITDIYDGKIARKQHLVTNFGKFMDPIADKILVISALLSYVSKHYISVWIAMIIITREFFITGMRLVGAGKGKIIAAGTLGKHKTAWQIVLVYELLVEEVLRDMMQLNIIPYYTSIFLTILLLKYFLIDIVIFFTVFSAYKYFVQNIDIFKGEDL